MKKLSLAFIAFLSVCTFITSYAFAWSWPWEDNDWIGCQSSLGGNCGPSSGYLYNCCGSLVCDVTAGSICRHDPPWEGEICSADLYNIGEGMCANPSRLYCKGFAGSGISGICTPYGKVGESCDGIVNLCGNILGNTGRMCRPKYDIWNPDEVSLVCHPNFLTFDMSSQISCENHWSKDVHDQVIAAAEEKGEELAWSFTSGTTEGIGGVFSTEYGVIYASDGTYACFSASCWGLSTTVGIQTFSAFAEYSGFEDFKDGFAIGNFSAGYILGYSSASIYKSIDVTDPAGFQTSFWLEFDIANMLTGIGSEVLNCTTNIRYTSHYTPGGGLVAVEMPPSLQCINKSVCADPITCSGEANISKTLGTEPVPVIQLPEGPYEIGINEVTLNPEIEGDAESCSALLEVMDCNPPYVECPTPVTLECQENGYADVEHVPPQVTDCTEVEIFYPEDNLYPLGTIEVSYMVVDESSNAAKCDTTVTVIDTLPPDILSMTAKPSRLWPPNHKMNNIEITYEVADLCDPQASCHIVDILSSEPLDSNGDGYTTDMDMKIINDHLVQLRAERSGTGSDRVYTVWLECTDSTAGNTSRKSVEILVPHDNASSKKMQR